MARKRGKVALYEVMSKIQAKSDSGSSVEPLHSTKKPEPAKPVPEVEEIDVPEPQVAVNWRKKPRIVQYNLGRIEFSIPYQLAITAVLVLILLLLLAFRFGYSAGGNRQPVSEPAGSPQGNRRAELTDLSSSGSTRTPVTVNEIRPPESRRTVPALGDADGTFVIVLAEYNSQTQLEPVKDYFYKKGITTDIVPFGSSRYQLRTIDKFRDNPSNSGTKGNEVIKKIEELGKGYEAPQGFETFAPNKFNDAYGKNVGN